MAIRNVTIENCVITNSNRGIAFMVFDGGLLENVIVTNVVVECRPFDWFWWGDADPIHFNLIRRSEIDPNVDKAKEPAIGAMRNIVLRNIIAQGAGRCRIHGSPDAPIENVLLENVRLILADSPDVPLDKSGDALTVDYVRNLRLKDVEIGWATPHLGNWRSALVLENAEDVTLDGVRVQGVLNAPDVAAIVLKDVNGAIVRHCTALSSTRPFVQVAGAQSRNIHLLNNYGGSDAPG